MFIQFIIDVVLPLSMANKDEYYRDDFASHVNISDVGVGSTRYIDWFCINYKQL